jgi:hypothetical protein
LSVSPGRPTASKEGRIEPQPFTTSVGRTAFTCYIRSGLRPAPPTHRIAECRVGFGWGSIVWLDLPQGLGQRGTSEYGCSDYAPVDSSAPTLDYGQSITFSGATCTSMRVGLRCSNGSHGFFLSRQHSYLF